MVKFHILTIFPEIFSCYFNESIISRAEKKQLVKINIYNLRNFTRDKHKTVDDRPYGGGPGMVMMIKPIYKAVFKILSKKFRFEDLKQLKKIKKYKSTTKIILFSAKGKKFDQKMAKKLSKLEDLIMICGRYEGVDERVAEHIADYKISMGNYILTGGELPAMIVVDAVSRLIPGVIRTESLKDESFSFREGDLLVEYPQYTRPEIFYPNPKNKKVFWRVPKILLSGNHKKIKEWREKNRKLIS